MDRKSQAQFRLLVAVARADGRLDAAEVEFLKTLLGPIRQSALPELLAEDVDVEAELAQLDDGERQRLYQSAFALAYADGHAAVSEVNALKHIVPDEGERTMLGQVFGETLDTLVPGRILAVADPVQREMEITEDVLKYATLAAVAGAMPLPGVGIIADLAVIALQTKMVHDIGQYWGHTMDSRGDPRVHRQRRRIRGPADRGEQPGPVRPGVGIGGGGGDQLRHHLRPGRRGPALLRGRPGPRRVRAEEPVRRAADPGSLGLRAAKGRVRGSQGNPRPGHRRPRPPLRVRGADAGGIRRRRRVPRRLIEVVHPEPGADAQGALLALPEEGLGRFEALAVRGMTRWNRSSTAKALVYLFVRYVSHTWIQAVTSRRLQIVGADHIIDLDPPRGVLLVANHRTFWDMYVATSVLAAHTDFARKFFFPVRSRFFYTHPLGVVVNFAVSGGSMWPPMASGFDRLGRSAASLEQLARTLDAPRTVAGIHPEGTRNRRSDLLDLLPAKGGAGRLIQACHPDTLVLPFFLSGLTDAFVVEVARNFRREGHRGPPIRIAFGAPIPAGDFPRDVAPLIVARQILERVRTLGPTGA